MKSLVASCIAASFFLAAPVLASDSQPPVITAVSISPNSVDVSSNSQTVTATLTITDDDSGFQGGNLNLYRPNSGTGAYVKSFTIPATPTTGDNLNGTYEVTVEIPLYSPPGAWWLEASIYDHTYNYEYYGPGPGEHPFPVPADTIISVANTGTVDTTGPTITNINYDPLTVSTGAGPATVTVTFDASDTESGVDYGYFQFYDPNFNYVNGVDEYIGPAQRVSGDEYSGSYEVTATLPQGSMTGTWTLETYMRDGVGNYTFAASQNLEVTAGAATLADALDAVQYTWSTSTPGWKRQSLVTHDGVDAAKSEPTADDEYRTLETTVTGPGTLSFHWKVDSQENKDYLSVEISSISEYQDISGDVDWEEVIIPLPPGSHTVVWRYDKDSSGSAGADCGWVDQVRFLADSDVDLPVLQSVDISPSSVDVSGGGETVTVTIEASDDYEGIYEGYVYLIDPSGNEHDSQYFQAGDEISGNSNYGTYEFYFDLYDYDLTGNWRVEVELYEETTYNSVYYGPGGLDFPSPGQETFSVSFGSGGGDAPLIEDISISQTTVDVTGGPATFDVTMRITDDSEGFSYGSFTINGPGGERLYTYFDFFDQISGDDYDGIYQFSVTVPQYAQGGTWDFEVGVEDYAQNYRDYPYDPPYGLPGDDSISVINTSGTYDTTDPVITSFTVSTNSVNASAAPAPITVDVTITDSPSGILDAYLYLYTPTDQYRSLVQLEAANRTSGDEFNGTYQAVLTIPMGAAQGIWTVRSFLRDRTGNSINYGYSFTGSPAMPGPSSASITNGTAPSSTYQAFVSLYSLVGTDALPNADPDHDGIPNAAELMLGSSPNSSSTGPNRISVSESGGFLHLDFTIDANLSVTTSGDFLELSDGGGGAPLRVTGQTQLGLASSWSNTLPMHQSGATYRVSMAITPGGNGFARLFFE